jgi:DNA sulfur modification protein DndC
MSKPRSKVLLRKSVFSQRGVTATVDGICKEIQQLYTGDSIPWLVGYSGGKDSSAVLQLVWLAIRELPFERRSKPIYVVSTDTLVEQPVVAAWVDGSLVRMRQAATEQQLPVIPCRLVPNVRDLFWVNLIGKGYPAPRASFRWCTSRMKINPSNQFIRDVVSESGEAILVLGTRKAESQRRARSMAEHEKRRVRERLAPNAGLPNSLVYTPIEDWSNDDVWLFLMQVKNPWGHTNKSLLGMYQGASADGECPLVVDTSTPSCGSSRFGCWVCTVVDQDRSMEAMIKNDDEKLWMMPLLELRNELGDFSKEKLRRDFRRMNGRVYLDVSKEGKDALHVRGPYAKVAREYWLRRVLEAQQEARRLGPPEFQSLELISMAELQEIRRIWLYEKHEFDDQLPQIYQQVMGQPFPKPDADDQLLRLEDWELLREVCGYEEQFFELQTGLLDIERQFRGMARRAGIYQALEERLKAGQFASEEEALNIRTEEERRRKDAVRNEASQSATTATRQKTLFEG